MQRKQPKSKIIERPKLDGEQLPEVYAAIESYANARRAFIGKQASTGHWLAGNDNKVGAIAEFWVKLLYDKEGFDITEIPSANNAGWDFKARKGEKELKVSVKAVTTENQGGGQVQLIKGKKGDEISWNEVKWDELALITLNKNLKPEAIGVWPKAEVQALHENEEKSFHAHSAVHRDWHTRWMREHGARFPDLKVLE